MWRRSLLLLFVLATGALAQAQDIDIPYQKFVLSKRPHLDSPRGPQSAHRGREPVVQTDKTKESLTEVNKELRAILADRPVTEEELVRVQANETLSLPGSRETLNSVGSSITDLVQFRWRDDYYDTMAGKIRALKTSDLDAAAKQVIHPDNIVWVVVGDRAKIESSIREVNFGEIRFIDADGNPIPSGPTASR